MAAAALNYGPSETLLISDGGLASFLTATVGDWADDDEDIPQNGIAQVTHIADRLAEYGRHEDEYMVHAAEGETVIPMAVLEANPRLRKSLFAQMEMMGLEPERYVVGSELNSINPVTGQPEFFLKKLFKSVKKLVKKVVKVVKKAIPIILPIALSFTPLGPVFGSALGSGIGTLMQGGDFKAALKAAIISGGIGGLTAGIKGGFTTKAAGGTFGEGFKTGAQTAFGNVGERFGQALGGVRPEGAGYWDDPFRAIEAPAATPTLPAATAQPGAQTSPLSSPQVPDTSTWQSLGPGETGLPAPTQAQALTAGAPRTSQLPYQDFRNVQPRIEQAGAPRTSQLPYQDFPKVEPRIEQAGAPSSPDLSDVQKNFQERFFEQPTSRPFDATTSLIEDASKDPLTGDQGWWDKTKGWWGEHISPSGREEAYFEKVKNQQMLAGSTEVEAAKEAQRALNEMGTLSKYGPSIALAYGAVGAGTGAFSGPEEEEDEDEDEDDPYKDYKYTPSLYGFQAPPAYTLEDIRIPGRQVGFADGGITSLEEFPRRSGGIAGPGTGRSDDVPAMLSDGEFVMTARAVKGAGNGSRKNGMKNMYQMMRTFEGAA
jgi:hypothetical protein